MSLKSELEAQGRWLFRWRSVVPLAFLPAVAVVLANMTWPFGSLVFREVWEFICLAVSFAGLAVRVVAIGFVPANTSGRNTQFQLADSLNTAGLYSIVRHPLYLGNFLIALGAVMVPFVWWLVALYALGFWLYYERIMIAEEEFLYSKFGHEFDQWACATPAFLQRLSRWRPAERASCWRTVLKREYTGLLVVIALHAGIEVVEHWHIDHRIQLELFWELLLSGGVLTYFVLRTLKRHTFLLNERGR